MTDSSSPLGPLKPTTPPVVSVEALVTIGTVTLSSGDAPRGKLKDFYVKMLGLTFLDATEDVIRFRHQQRYIVLERGRGEPGRAGLLIRNFGEMLMKLRQRGVGLEVLHTDSGLTRVAIVRDPADNWLHLLETRAF